MELTTLVAGAVAGCLGAMLGVGGGVLLVPLLHVGMGLQFSEARAVSLVGVLATSCSVSASASRRLINPRLATVLLVFSVSGVIFGESVRGYLSDATLERVFGATAALIAIVMLGRLDRRNVVTEPGFSTGVLGGRFRDDDTGSEVAYRLRRLPVAAGVSVSAGILASFVGVGGGMFVVPALNSWCGVPLRAAAATSAFMIGVTAVPAVLGQWSDGHLGSFRLAAAAALGVLGGFRAGQWLSPRARVQWLKLLMAMLLLGVAVEYLLLR